MPNFNRFTDPKTGSPLTYDEKEQKLLGADGASYPVIGGIPRFVSAELYAESSMAGSGELQTGRSFGDKWRDDRFRSIGQSEFDRFSLKEQFMAMLGCESEEQMQRLFDGARTTLNAGCGVAWSEFLFDLNPSAERHCVDLSLAVEMAREKTAHMPNVTLSQASILELPYADETFDIVYSDGVVHHTPDPRGAVLELGRTVVPGGLLGIYIYNVKPLIREIADREIRERTTKMSYEECLDFSRKMTMLGKALSACDTPLVIEEDIELLGIKAGTYNLQRFVYDHMIKCWYNSTQDEEYADLVNLDWYHPYYASHHSREEVFGWFGEMGFEQPECLQPPGWEHSGMFISGRKRS